MLIAEHSMCQPGRPGPNGEGQDGSPGFSPFQSTKSLTSSFSYSSSATRSPRRICAEVDLREPSVAGKRRDPEIDGTVRLVGVPALPQPLDQRDHLGDVLGGARVALGLLDVERRDVAEEGLDVRRREVVRARRPPASAPRIVLSSTSVRFMICVTRRPPGEQVAAQDVLEDEGAQVSDVDDVVDRRAARVEADVPRLERRKSHERPAERVVQLHRYHIPRACVRLDFAPRQLPLQPPQAIDVEDAVQVIDLVAERPGEKPRPLELALDSRARRKNRARTRAGRTTRSEKSGIERQPSSSFCSPDDSTIGGLTSAIRASGSAPTDRSMTATR